LALPEEQREKRYKAERKSINDAIDEFHDSDLLQRFYSNEVARRRGKPNQPRAGQGGLTYRSRDIDDLEKRPPNWDPETDYTPPPRERRDEAKAIVTRLATFGLPYVGTEGFGCIYLRYEDLQYSVIRCSSKGIWKYILEYCVHLRM
jgi:hypothetical protein